jgi:hypothetical protein
MINVVFHTNVDAKFGSWYFPKQVCIEPKIGHLVQPNNDDQTLWICQITHCFKNNEPYLEIELTKKY